MGNAVAAITTELLWAAGEAPCMLLAPGTDRVHVA